MCVKYGYGRHEIACEPFLKRGSCYQPSVRSDLMEARSLVKHGPCHQRHERLKLMRIDEELVMRAGISMRNMLVLSGGESAGGGHGALLQYCVCRSNSDAQLSKVPHQSHLKCLKNVITR